MVRFDATPGPQLKPAKVRYHQVDSNSLTIGHVVSKTPPPPGSTSFHSVEVVHAGGPVFERLRRAPRIDATYPVRFHELPETGCSPAREFAAIFEVLEGMMLAKANRQSLVLWVGRPDKPELDGFAGFLGMLPFRGISVALVSADAVRYPDPFSYRTPSGVLEHDANDPARMGKCCVSAMFGPLPARSFTARLREWAPIDVQPPAGCTELLRLPFKIAGLPLPMITYAGEYEKGVAALAERISAAYPAGALCPIVSCGEVVDRLGYGLDVLAALRERGHAGHYFTHKSGETSKRWAEYGKPELLGWVAQAKAAGQTPLFIAVGGGCNGNATGVVAAMTGAAFVEVPTTPLHYNDATTSAKKAFSLVLDGKIRAKNLLGTFYLPRLVWCINETFLTSSTASVHSTVGECTKTMNMLADPSSAAGRADYANILGANEFASDTTRILSCIDGFEALVHFIEDAPTREAKAAVLRLGEAIAEARAAAQCGTETARAAYASLCEGRRQLLQRFRARFYELPTAARVAIDAFLTVSNKEIVGAKAMFLAYEDPFEKYRALLFEYAHTLGHAVEAWLAGAIDTARASGVGADIVEAAVRNHGQCVGMAVVWAGAIAAELGALEGDGYVCHQGMVYLFNSFGGFSFGPVRALCDALGVSKPDFLREVLAGVRLDNKRGYCECGDDASVDQLVTHRPGRMLGSEDPNAEVRYMVVVSEELQRRALERAFELEFDLVAHIDGGEIAFKPLASHPRPLGVGAPIAAQVRKLIRASCDADAAAAAAEGIVCGPASDEAAGDEAAGDEAAGEAAPAPRRSASETMSLEGTPPSWSEDDESASLSPFSRAATFEAELCETSEARPGHAPPPPAAALKPASPASKPAAAAKRDHDLANGGAAPSGEEAAKQLAVPGEGSFEIRHSGRSMRAARPRVGSAVASGEASAHPPAA